MESCRDFVQMLGHDLSMRILMSLENPSDIVRFSAVSTSWRDFAIVNGLSKQLCLKKYPELSKITNTIEESKKRQHGSHKTREQKILERDHKVFAYLARGLANYNTCISNAVFASSTDTYPEETIQNTLDPRERIDDRYLYWSSTGQTNPTISEKLVYYLISNVCIVTDIRVQPFEERSYENIYSIYSPRAVRFRMGYPKSPLEVDDYGRFKYKASRKYDENAFSWMYISPKFSMAQENSLQNFKLPEPVLCIGGILQVDLLGRAQRKETNNLYYICISHVQVLGRPLLPGFDVEIVDSLGRCKLHYYPGVNYRYSPRNTISFRNRYSMFRKPFEFLGEGVKFISNSKCGSQSIILFLVIAFICLDFLIKLFKVSSRRYE